MVTFDEHPCPYLPGRMARDRAFWADRFPAGLYEKFEDSAFRRSGHVVYQPVCKGCRQCVPIRVPVNRFQPSKSQRRSLRKNSDLQIEVGPPIATPEKFSLYQKYTADWHGAKPKETSEDFESFLYQSPVETLEFSYRDSAGQLLAVGICDFEPKSLSSVYFYFDPAHAARGLGTFSVVYELAYAKQRHLPHYYLGYFVAGCASMRYKSNFHPYELLGTDGVWRESSASSV